MDPLATEMAEIWSTEGFRKLPIPQRNGKVEKVWKKLKKKSVFFKNEGQISRVGVKYFYPRSALRMRIFRLYISNGARIAFDGQMQKTEFRSLSADLGHFLTSDVILIENFLSVIIDLAYRPNETFCSRTHRFCWEAKYRAGWKVAMFTEEAIIMLRILSSVGYAWRPPGHSRRLRPVLRVVCRCWCSRQSCVRWQLFLLVDMAVFNGFRTDLVYCSPFSNRRFKLSLSTVFVRLPLFTHCHCHCVLALVYSSPTTPPRFHIPRHFLPKV